ncbi:MAG: DUF72 domain-containing protein [Inquilinus sp.]|nr:DUF72 domain-containing protein [Inquilinus sp.]
MAASHWVGTSGWSYPNWAGPFYPAGLKQRDWLGFYARQLGTVEVNNSFYHLPREAMLRGWVERTPPGFLFAVKAWRAITHYRRLADCADHVAVFLDRVAMLGPKGGPVLFQLPPHWHADVDRLAGFLELLPEGRRFAMEFRDPSWHCDAVFDLLRARNVAFCPFELAGLTGPRVVTADFVYVRLHGRQSAYGGAYGEAALADWAAWLKANMAAGRDVHVYFDNTDEADHAVRDAQRLNGLLQARDPA